MSTAMQSNRSDRRGRTRDQSYQKPGQPWIMSKQIYSVKPDTPLFNIVHLKCKYDISCLPVVDTQGQTLGVVTTQDMLKGAVNIELEDMGVAVA